ncbi:MAG: AI-2E family transporter [Candidatus Nanohaloarchaeota archaeon QJJ-9]|nr:AI-2E family transporter [Candidatus Nanohaloarchaeota archaeon QJJ-9]
MIDRRDLVGLVLVAVSIYLLMPLMDSLVLGAVTAFILASLLDRAEVYMDRRVAEVVFMVVFVSAVSGGLYHVVSNAGMVSSQVSELSAVVTGNFESFIGSYDVPISSVFVTRIVSGFRSYVNSSIISMASGVPVLVFELLVYFATTFYLYREREKVGSSVDRMIDYLPEGEAEKVRFMRDDIVDLVRNIFATYGIFGVVMGVIGGVGLYLVGLVVRGEPIAFAWAWGVFIGLTAFVEGIGSIVLLGPLMLYYFVAGEVWMAVGVFVFWVAFLKVLPESFVLPYIGKSRMEASYISVFLGFTAGVLVFGVSGIVLGPVFIIGVKRIVLSYFEELD